MKNRSIISSLAIESINVTVAGRIVALRKMKNYCFCDMTDMSGKIQLVIADMELALPNVGDIVKAEGKTFITKTGQLSIECSHLQIISQSTIEVANALKNVSYNKFDINRQRSLNIITNEDLKKMIKVRSSFIEIIRQQLRLNGFLEIDAPVLSYSRFAGTADAFVVKSRKLDRDLYLRGTLEIYLKELIVAGFEKVFQVGDCFRNESPSLIEFTLLEANWAYADSTEMLNLIQDIIKSLCEQLSDSDVDPSIKRILAKKIVTVTFWDALNKYFGLDIRNITSYYSLIKHYQPMRYQKRFMYKILDVIDNKW